MAYKQFVRCKVCGAVFEAGAEKCPVCDAGPESFEPVNPAEIAFRNNTENLYLVLGGGVAAVSAAEAIRARDRTGNIVLLAGEPHAPYVRTNLTRQLGGGAAVAPIQPEAWYRDNNIQLYTGSRVRTLDPALREVTLEDGKTFRYDRCVYALGAECFVPPIPGADGPQCVAIRRPEDVTAIEALLPAAKTAAVIGGGVLGLEAAWALTMRGLSVSVIETGERLMARQLTPERSAKLLSDARNCGATVFLNAQTASIAPGTVTLAGGEAVPADIVVLSCGVRANAAIARAAGLRVERAVVVDAMMRTSERDVFACGDCAEFAGVNMAIWPEAAEQGRIAGANASDDMLQYAPETWPVVFSVFTGKP